MIKCGDVDGKGTECLLVRHYFCSMMPYCRVDRADILSDHICHCLEARRMMLTNNIACPGRPEPPEVKHG